MFGGGVTLDHLWEVTNAATSFLSYSCHCTYITMMYSLACVFCHKLNISAYSNSSFWLLCGKWPAEQKLKIAMVTLVNTSTPEALIIDMATSLTCKLGVNSVSCQRLWLSAWIKLRFVMLAVRHLVNSFIVTDKYTALTVNTANICWITSFVLLRILTFSLPAVYLSNALWTCTKLYTE